MDAALLKLSLEIQRHSGSINNFVESGLERGSLNQEIVVLRIGCVNYYSLVNIGNCYK